jgi:hypothetical protein
MYFAHPVRIPFCLPVLEAFASRFTYCAWIRTDAQNLILVTLVPLPGLPTGYTALQLPRVSSVDPFRATPRQ